MSDELEKKCTLCDSEAAYWLFAKTNLFDSKAALCSDHYQEAMKFFTDKGIEEAPTQEMVTTWIFTKTITCSGIRSGVALAAMRPLQTYPLTPAPPPSPFYGINYTSLNSILKQSYSGSFIYNEPPCSIVDKHLDKKGRYHNKKGPALVYEDGSHMYYVHGKLHNISREAVYIADEKSWKGCQFEESEYWIQGRKLTKEEWGLRLLKCWLEE